MPNNTIADNLQRLVDAKNDIADAIVAKGGTVNEGDGLEEFAADIATIPSGGDSNFKSNVNVTTEPNATVVATRVSYPVKVYAPVGAAINITDGYSVFTGVGAGENTAVNFLIPLNGTWDCYCTVDGGITVRRAFNIREFQEYEITIGFLKIYGVSWSGGSETTLTRTGDAAEFDNPDPYVNDGSHPGYSPFDGLFPWNGMRRVTINDNELVEIPKFWYKITKSGNAMSFQIANYPAEGFNVSPAHQYRGDGVGERDFAYVGRYHSTSTYKSQSGTLPLTSITRDTARTNIKNLGTGFYLWDYATLVTIWLLYIVEFANWNSQNCIGLGCGSSSSKQNTGASDNMPYHTGTMQTSRTGVWSVGCQYRGIEDLWGNVMDWIDGIRLSYLTIYIIKNPSKFSDMSGGVSTQSRPSSTGYIKYWTQPSATGYDWAIYPGAVDGSDSTYIPDHCVYNSNAYVLCVGGAYNNTNRQYGLFYLNGHFAPADTAAYIGARIMYLPPNN